MITFTSQLSEGELLRGVRWHYRTATRERWSLPLCGTFLIVVFGGFALSHPTEVLNYPLALLGFAVITLPLWRRPLVKRDIRRMPNLDKNIQWTVDESSVRGRGDGFDFSQDRPTFYSATITSEGLLLYPQRNMYYWLPSSGFSSLQDFREAADLIAAKITKTKRVQHRSARDSSKAADGLT